MSLIKNLAPPSSAADAVGSALIDLQVSNHNDGLLGGGTVHLSQPMPLFQLRLSDIKNGFDFSSAHLVGWRYLIESSDANEYAYADVQHAGSGTPEFAGLANNKNATRLMDAVRLAERVATDMPSDCEARLLDVPALKFSALWLAFDSDSVFIPYIDTQLPANRPLVTETSLHVSKRLLDEAETARSVEVGRTSFGGAVAP